MMVGIICPIKTFSVDNIAILCTHQVDPFPNKINVIGLFQTLSNTIRDLYIIICKATEKDMIFGGSNISLLGAR